MNKLSPTIPPSSPESADTSRTPPTPSSDLAALKALLVDVVAEQLGPLNATIADLQARVDRQTPRMEPMRHLDEEDLEPEEEEDGEPQNYREVFADLQKGETRDATKASIVRTANGRRIPKPMLANFEPLFHAQQKIQLNPEMTPPGGRFTWGEICEKVGSKGYGVVLKRYDVMGLRGYWVYHIYVQGVSQKMGFSIDEDQLLPARRKARGAA